MPLKLQNQLIFVEEAQKAANGGGAGGEESALRAEPLLRASWQDG